MNSNSYNYRGYTITIKNQYVATKNGVFVYEASTEPEIEQRIDEILDN